MNKKKTSFSIKIMFILGIILGIVFINTISNASDKYGRWGGNEEQGMPSPSVLSETGLLPQIYKDKEYTGKADITYPYGEWKIDISRGTVYCDDSGTMIRYGERDYEKYYVDWNGNPQDAYDAVKRKLEDLARADVPKGWLDGLTGVSYKEEGDTIDESKPLMTFINTPGVRAQMESFIKILMENIFSKLTEMHTTEPIADNNLNGRS